MNDFFSLYFFILHCVILYLLYLYIYCTIIHPLLPSSPLLISKQENPGEIPQNMACHQGLHGLLLDNRSNLDTMSSRQIQPGASVMALRLKMA